MNYVLVDNLCEVLEATAVVQRQWEELGIALGVDRTKLNEISQIYPSILQRHYHSMRFWITDIGASWRSLVCALQCELLNEEILAKKIETGMLIILQILKSVCSQLDKNQLFTKPFLLLSCVDHEGKPSRVHVKVLVTQNDKPLTGEL